MIGIPDAAIPTGSFPAISRAKAGRWCSLSQARRAESSCSVVGVALGPLIARPSARLATGHAPRVAPVSAAPIGLGTSKYGRQASARANAGTPQPWSRPFARASPGPQCAPEGAQGVPDADGVPPKALAPPGVPWSQSAIGPRALPKTPWCCQPGAASDAEAAGLGGFPRLG